ncbi:MAG: hypothetical protein R8M45_09710 [Ghiorsea sp.]
MTKTDVIIKLMGSREFSLYDELVTCDDGALLPTAAEIDAEYARLSANAPVQDKIQSLEAAQTSRLFREAIGGGQFATDKLAQIDAEILVLRATLK